METIKNVALPFFGGFYESEYYHSDSIYNEIYGDNSYFETYGSDDPNDYILEFESYKRDVCNEFCNVFDLEVPTFVKSVKLSKISSPTYYNYSTDKVYADIVLADNWREEIQDFMLFNREWLSERIRKDWTSRDGFWSFLSNDFNSWFVLFEDGEEVDERYLAEMIGYIMMHHFNKSKFGVRQELAYYVLENVYIGSYIKYVGE